MSWPFCHVLKDVKKNIKMFAGKQPSSVQSLTPDHGWVAQTLEDKTAIILTFVEQGASTHRFTTTTASAPPQEKILNDRLFSPRYHFSSFLNPSMIPFHTKTAFPLLP